MLFFTQSRFSALLPARLPARQKYRSAVTSAVASVLIMGCGGGGGDSAPSTLAATAGPVLLPAGIITKIGNVTLTAVDGDGLANSGLPAGIIGGYGEFSEYDSAIDASFIESEFQLSSNDSCELQILNEYNVAQKSDKSGRAIGNALTDMVTKARQSTNTHLTVGLNSTLHNDGAFEDSTDSQVRADTQSLDAGEAINIITPTGSWPDLVRFNDPDPYYAFEDGAVTLGDVPAGTTLTIPGNEFPALNNVALNTVSRITNGEVSNTNDNLLSAGTNVSWTPPSSNGAGNYTVLMINSYVVEPETNVEMEVLLVCTLIDDGKFTIPETYNDLFTTYEFTKEDMTIVRMAISTAVKEEAAIIGVNGSVYFFQ